jgi:DNA-binding MarR family transcriptional regulator
VKTDKALSLQSLPRAKLTTVDPTGEFPCGVEHYLLHLLVGCCRFRDASLNILLREFDLNVGTFRMLAMLHHRGITTMSDASLLMSVDRTTLTRAVDRLVVRDFVVRTFSDRDRRKVMLELTYRGEDMYFDCLTEIKDRNVMMLSGISEDEQRSAARVLLKLVANVAPNDATRQAVIEVSRGI